MRGRQVAETLSEITRKLAPRQAASRFHNDLVVCR